MEAIGAAGLDRTAAFEFWVEPWLDAGFALACAMLRDRAAAEDAVQDAALKAWRHLHQPPSDVSDRQARAWFLTVVANRCRDMKRGSWWRVIRSGDLPEQVTPDPTANVADEVTIDQAMARLGRDQRAILLLRYRLDMDVNQIAMVLSLRPGTVKSRLHRAHRALQEALR